MPAQNSVAISFQERALLSDCRDFCRFLGNDIDKILPHHPNYETGFLGGDHEL
jgi:hypothetical protein